MKKIGIILLCMIMLSACGTKTETVKKPAIEFIEGDVTIDLNGEYYLNDYITVNDENTSYEATLDVENSKIVITLENNGSDEIETIEKPVVIIPKEASSLEELDYTKGCLVMTCDLREFALVIFDEMSSESQITANGGVYWIDILNKDGNTYTLEIGASASFGVVPFDITIDDPTYFESPIVIRTASMYTSGLFYTNDRDARAKFEFVPYSGEMKIKVNADKLRIRSDHNSDAEIVGEVNSNEEYTSYERVVDSRIGGIWHRIGDNQWIAGGTYDGAYVDTIK